MKTKTQFMSKTQVKMFLAKDAAADILEPLVDALLANRLVQAQILDALKESVKRSLKVSLSDDDVKLSVAECNVEAEAIAKDLMERLTVKDPSEVSNDVVNVLLASGALIWIDHLKTRTPNGHIGLSVRGWVSTKFQHGGYKSDRILTSSATPRPPIQLASTIFRLFLACTFTRSATSAGFEVC